MGVQSTDLVPKRVDALYRPQLSGNGVEGSRCSACQYAVAPPTPRCPACGEPSVSVAFGVVGTVWGSTVVHIPVGDRPPPFGLAYVDLDDGPRVLVGTAAACVFPVGQRVRLEIEAGDLVAIESPPE
jgi:uncharacterized OB-fold protein